jgi:hypothetical protein
MDAFSTTVDFIGAAMAVPSSARHFNHVTAAKNRPMRAHRTPEG